MCTDCRQAARRAREAQAAAEPLESDWDAVATMPDGTSKLDYTDD